MRDKQLLFFQPFEIELSPNIFFHFFTKNKNTSLSLSINIYCIKVIAHFIFEDQEKKKFYKCMSKKKNIC